MDTKDWYAWINLEPPKPDELHVIGEVFVSNPGVQAELCVREPQGIIRESLLLDLHLVQRPGMWPQVMTWIQCRYDKILSPDSPRYEKIEVYYNGEQITVVDVDIITVK